MFTVRRHKNIHLKVSAGSRIRRMLQIEATTHDLCGCTPWAPSTLYASISLGWGRGTGFLKNKQTKGVGEPAQSWLGQSGLTYCLLPFFAYFSSIPWYQWRKIQSSNLPGRVQKTEPLYSVESFRISASFFRVLSPC